MKEKQTHSRPQTAPKLEASSSSSAQDSLEVQGAHVERVKEEEEEQEEASPSFELLAGRTGLNGQSSSTSSTSTMTFPEDTTTSKSSTTSSVEEEDSSYYDSEDDSDDNLNISSDAAPSAFNPRESPLCRTRVSYLYPKLALNADSKFRFIINDPDENYVQVVRVRFGPIFLERKSLNLTLFFVLQIEKCTDAGSECKLIRGQSLWEEYGIRTVCRQKYIYRRLLALDENGTDVVDLFKFPSCCVCYHVEETPDSQYLY